MRITRIIFILAALWPQTLLAENSRLARGFMQFSQGRFCGQVTNKDLTNSGYSCDSKDYHPGEAVEYAHGMFEEAVFQQAAQYYEQKSRCMTEQISVILKNPEKKKEWYDILAKAWLRQKKAQLILGRCQFATRGINPTEARLKGKEHVCSPLKEMKLTPEEYKAQCDELMSVPENQQRARQMGRQLAADSAAQKGVRKKLSPEWLNTCANEGEMDAYRAVKEMTRYSIPVISNSEILDAFERHRSVFISKKTGKPLTDQELLATDLRTMDSFRVVYNKRFQDDVNGQLDGITKERKTMINRLSSHKDEKGYVLEQDMKDNIFKDNSVYQVLIEKKLIPENHEGLGSSPREEVSNGAFCLLAKYEESASGEIVDTLATSVVSGAAIYKLFKGTRILRIMGSAAGQQGGTALGAGASATLLRQCVDRIDPRKDHLTNKTESRSRNMEAVMAKNVHMRPELAVRVKVMDFDPKATPSCQSAQVKDLLADPAYNTSLLQCFADAGPMGVSAAVMLLEGF